MSAAGYILDNDGPPTLSVGGLGITEGNGAAELVATLSYPCGTYVSGSYATRDGTAVGDAGLGGDYMTTSGGLYFQSGAVYQCFSVYITDDSRYEPTPEGFYVDYWSTVGDGTATVTIYDDDPEPVFLTLGPGSCGESDGQMTFTFTLSNANQSSVEVPWATDGLDASCSMAPATSGADYTPTTGTAVFPPGATQATVTVPILDDEYCEPDEGFLLRVAPGSSGCAYDPPYTYPTAVGTIEDDDPGVDLAIDSNNDGTIDATPGGSDDGIESSGIGRIVGVGDRTLAPMAVDAFFQGRESEVTGLRLVFDGDGDSIKVWDSPDKTTRVSSGHVWTPATGDFHTTVYIEAVGAGTRALTATLEGLQGVPAPTDEVNVRAVEVASTKVEVKEYDGSWTELGASDGFWEEYVLRWSAEGVPADVLPYVTGVEWWARPWSESGNPPPEEWLPEEYTVFASASGLSPLEAQLMGGALGDWVVTPAVQFGNGGYCAERFPKQRGTYRTTAVTWEGYDPGDGNTNFEADGNPTAYGGGDRIFPEQNQPTGRAGDQLHDYLFVKVTIDRAVRGNLTVDRFLRGFDPDHYSTDEHFDPNGIFAPDDNQLPSVPLINLNYGAQFCGWEAVNRQFVGPTWDIQALPPPQWAAVTFSAADATATRKLGFQILARQPGNNYIVVGDARKSALQEVTFAPDGVTPVVRRPDWEDDVVPESNRTKMLTVWRTLYAELDSMAAPNYDLGPFPSRIAEGDVVQVNPFAPDSITIDDSLKDETTDNRFQGGRITLFDEDAEGNWVELGTFSILENSKIPEGNGRSVIVLTAAAPAGAKHFRNLVDDDVAHGVTAAEMVPNASLWARFFEPALVRVDLSKHDLSPVNANSVNQTDIGFLPNLGETEWTTLIAANTMIQAVSEPNFWVISQLGAFQPHRGVDADPDAPEAVLGRALPDPNDFPRIIQSAVFRETVRDFAFVGQYGYGLPDPESAQETSAHEAMHHFLIGDGSDWGTLMDAVYVSQLHCAEDVYSLSLSGIALRRIGMTRYPGMPIS